LCSEYNSEVETAVEPNEPPLQYGPELPTAFERLQILRKSQQEVSQLNNKLKIQRFGLERYSTDSEKLKFYEGFKQHVFLVAFLSGWYLLHDRKKVISITLGAQRALPLIDEFFWFCVDFIQDSLLKIWQTVWIFQLPQLAEYFWHG